MRNIFQQIGQAWKIGHNRIAYLPFIFVLIAIEVYFWINGGAHFPNWDSSYSNLILIYLGMTVVFLFWSGRSTQSQMRTPLHQGIKVFVPFFIGTYIILFFLNILGVLSTGTLDPDLFWQTVLVQVCVVATSEELMFRGVLLELMGPLFSAILFAVWHGFSYGFRYYELTFSLESFNLFAMFFAFVMGLLLAKIAQEKKFGLPATIAIHASYNLFIVGAFYTFGGIL